MKIDSSDGWAELIIEENCSRERFYEVARILRTNLKVVFTNKISDLDSIYWDFIYLTAQLTLHYNHFRGICIFPEALRNSTDLDTKIIIEVSQILPLHL